MANRSYLYSADFSEGSKPTFKDLSEWRSEVPLSHSILLSGDTQLVNSSIWNYDEAPIALVGDYAIGLKRLLAFLDLLEKQPQTQERSDLLEEIAQTRSFFDDPRKTAKSFFLEAGEVFDLMGGDLGGHAARLHADVLAIGKEVDRLVAENANPWTDARLWFFSNALKNNNLGLYWTHVLYFHLGSWK